MWPKIWLKIYNDSLSYNGGDPDNRGRGYLNIKYNKDNKYLNWWSHMTCSTIDIKGNNSAASINGQHDDFD